MISMCVGSFIIALLIILILLFMVKKYYVSSRKFQLLFNTLNKWMLARNHGLSIGRYLNENRYKKIAIYGLGQIGERLEEYLRAEGFEVVFGIDEKIKLVSSRMPIVKMSDFSSMQKPDVIIVTADIGEKNVMAELHMSTKIPVISLEKLSIITVYGEYAK